VLRVIETVAIPEDVFERIGALTHLGNLILGYNEKM
jgi:hypothetical protein